MSTKPGATLAKLRQIKARLTSNVREAAILKRSSGYCHLLVKSKPSNFDVLLLAVGTLAAIAAGVPFPLLGILFGELVDELNTGACASSQDRSVPGLQSSVNAKVLLIVYITIANFFAIYIHTGCWSLFGERLVRRLRENYFRGLLRQEIAFFDTLPAGDVATRLTDDLETIRSGTSEKVGIVISSFSYLFGAYVVAFIKNAELAGILLCLIPAYLAMAMVGGRYVGRFTSRMTKHIGAATSIASECLSNVGLIHAFGARARLEAKFALNLEKAQKAGLQKAAATATQAGFLFFIAYSANALAFWQGSLAIAANANNNESGITAGAVYTVIFLLVDASFIISQIAPFFQIFATAAAASKGLFSIVDRSSNINGSPSSQGEYLDHVTGAITFQDVTFRYPSRPDTRVLGDVCIHISAGKHTAIVGPSGSGKSTIAALVTRLYDPTRGHILLDGHNLTGVNVRFLRSCIGVVQQDSWLLNRSVLENIAHGLVNSEATFKSEYESALLGPALSALVKAVHDGQDFTAAVVAQGPTITTIVDLVRNAAVLADADEFISNLEHGYATVIGSKGGELSGGQKQRIALARALVKDPRVLVLDEATSSLDSASEQTIQSSLMKVIQGRTTISIAHRLSTVKDADNIIVLQGGQVIEQGTHAELLAKDDTYARMVKTQTLQHPPIVQSRPPLRRYFSSDPLYPTSQGKTPSDDSKSANPAKGDASDSGQIIKDDDRRQQVDVVGSQRSLPSTVAGIASLARPQLLFVFIGISAATIVGGAYSGEAVIFGHTIGSFSPCRGPVDIRASGKLYALLFFFFAILVLSANVVSGSIFGRVAEKMVMRVRILAFRSLFLQSLQWHTSDGRSPALLLPYLSSDASALAGLSGTTVGTVVSILVNLMAGIIMTHIIAWKIAVVLIATLPILLGSGVMRLRVLAHLQDRHQVAYATSVGITVEAVNSMRSVANLGLEKEMLATYRRSLVSPYKASFREIAYAVFWLATAYSVSNLIYALAYWWGTKQVVAGTYSQTQFFIVLPALLFSAQSCGQMFALAPDLSKARVASARLLDLLAIGPDKSSTSFGESGDSLIDTEKSERDLETGMGGKSCVMASPNHLGISVKFNDVHFAYPARPHLPILQGINLEIRQGSFCALVGPSGAGKSTIISLLERFYEPTSGSIELDGRLTASGDTTFRDRISLVPQESALFDDTIRFNLAIGARSGHEVTDEEIETACKLANIHDTIADLPQAYDTRCGPNGDRFSGGQKQRLSIARALVRQPSLLLLDESTSALDADSEARFQDTLDEISKRMTVIAIAHRLHTIMKAQIIFVIEDGQCIDRGTHAELVQRSPSYRANAMHQSLDV